MEKEELKTLKEINEKLGFLVAARAGMPFKVTGEMVKRFCDYYGYPIFKKGDRVMYAYDYENKEKKKAMEFIEYRYTSFGIRGFTKDMEYCELEFLTRG